MIHHISIQVSDLEASAKLYDGMLFALDYKRAFTMEIAVGYGFVIDKEKDIFAIRKMGLPVTVPSEGFYVAFTAKSRKDVDLFFKAALRFGAKNNGKPGLRKHYGPDYYAAFVIDLDGHRLEAVNK